MEDRTLGAPFKGAISHQKRVAEGLPALVVKTGVALPDRVYHQLLHIAEKMGYTSLSKAIRDAVELFVAFNRWWLHQGPVAGSLQLVLDQHDEKVLQRVSEAERRYSDIVYVSLRAPMPGGLMLYILVVRGDGGKVKELYRSLANTRGVLSVQASLVPCGEEPETVSRGGETVSTC